MSKTQSSTPAGQCGCAAGDSATGRKATGVDPSVKDANLKHLRRIEGQVRGIIRMVDEDRYCADIVIQIAAIRESLQSVSKNLLRNHLRYCAAEAVKAGGSRADGMYDELVDLVGKIAR
jgi:CsoR family transcriptional regulator, copper-sensing transcriptional repressor